MYKRIFLGGTTGDNGWRKALKADLMARGISESAFFDPMVEQWSEEVQALEDQAKADPETIMLFYLADTGRAEGMFLSFYSLFEATMGLYDDRERTCVVFDYRGLLRRAAKRLKKVCYMLKARFPQAAVFESVGDAEQWLVKKLGK